MTAHEAARHGLARLEDLLEQLPPGLGVPLEVKSGLHDAGRPPNATAATLLARMCTRGLGNRPVVCLLDASVLFETRRRVGNCP